ncbi:aminoglycoside phosphotransferase family protein, partial [Actinocatenispora rupis]
GLCHADASPWNILTGKDERLYLIDPRGITGEVAYDAAIIALKAATRIPVEATARGLDSMLGIDSDRVLSWVLVAVAARV